MQEEHSYESLLSWKRAVQDFQMIIDDEIVISIDDREHAVNFLHLSKELVELAHWQLEVHTFLVLFVLSLKL